MLSIAGQYWHSTSLPLFVKRQIKQWGWHPKSLCTPLSINTQQTRQYGPQLVVCCQLIKDYTEVTRLTDHFQGSDLISVQYGAQQSPPARLIPTPFPTGKPRVVDKTTVSWHQGDRRELSSIHWGSRAATRTNSGRRFGFQVPPDIAALDSEVSQPIMTSGVSACGWPRESGQENTYFSPNFC